MSQSEPIIFIDRSRRVSGLPEPRTIVKLSRAITREARASSSATAQASAACSIPLIIEPGGSPCAWVKYGDTVTMNEASTQDYTWEFLQRNPTNSVRVACVYLAFQYARSGFIVMEYVDGTVCENSDAPQAAAAVQSLIAIPAPSLQPGLIDGGPIVHPFFIDWRSSVSYDSVELLQTHINRILKIKGSSRRIDFGPEVNAHGLRLCPADLNRRNFMKDKEHNIVAVDFGASSFLPITFFAHAVSNSLNLFTQSIAKQITYPRPTSAQTNALLEASQALVPYMSNDVGLPGELKRQLQRT